jgi:hypothetical protein
MQRVLVIHDDPAATSASIKRGLVYEGYSVDTAATAMAGLAIAPLHRARMEERRRDFHRWRMDSCPRNMNSQLPWRRTHDVEWKGP